MQSFLRAGFVLGLALMAACGKDSPTPVDFTNPAGISSNLSSVDSTFDSDVFRSFNSAALMLDPAAPSIQPTTTLIAALRPKLERSGGQIFLPALLQSRKLQALIPNLSVSQAQGRLIPDSLYGRMFEWDTAANVYSYQGNTVSNLNGVRFVLYALGLDGEVFEPVTAIGTLDIIDQSTPSQLQLHVLVKNSAGTITYLDYTATLQASQTAVNATVTGFISNGDNKTLSFNETFSANAGGVSVHATFDLDNPAITLMLNESVTFNNPNITINADFRLIEGGQTIRAVGRVVINTFDQTVDVHVTVYVDGHPVASVDGDPADPATQWVDAGGEPLTVADLAALDDLFNAFENFDQTVAGFFGPIGVFTGAP
jgi:hypothetical protein